ncbi:MAG: hypothetical protein OXB90_03265 [Acidimicrobiaceae bacterium]|nr:hypothetical protein [Acidimicrobiaceae bacterium]
MITDPDAKEPLLNFGEANAAPKVSLPRGRRLRKRPAPGANRFWSVMFPVLVIAAAVLVFAVWRYGTKLVLDSNAGERIETITDPSAPGYKAFVAPTPTLLIAHLDDGGELVGLTIMAQTALQQGGTAVIVSAEMLLPSEVDPDESILVRELYANDGLEGLSRVVGDLFGFGFTDRIALDSSALSNYLRFVEPLVLVLPDDLVEIGDNGIRQVVFRAGERRLGAVQAAAVYGWLNPGEFDANRTERQRALWESWFDGVTKLADQQTTSPAGADVLSDYLWAFAGGNRRLEVLPLQAVLTDGDDLPVYTVTTEHIEYLKLLAKEIVPLPIAPYAGARPRVSLLDGTGIGTLRDTMLPVLVDAGAEVTVIGNVASFGVAETTVDYHVVEHRNAANTLADAIGASVRFVEDLNQPVDLTVTVGLDRVGS